MNHASIGDIINAVPISEHGDWVRCCLCGGSPTRFAILTYSAGLDFAALRAAWCERPECLYDRSMAIEPGRYLDCSEYIGTAILRAVKSS